MVHDMRGQDKGAGISARWRSGGIPVRPVETCSLRSWSISTSRSTPLRPPWYVLQVCDTSLPAPRKRAHGRVGMSLAPCKAFASLGSLGCALVVTTAG